jgi:hypothetical protein
MSIERIFYPAATMAAGSVSYLGGVKELQFRVMNLMRISLKRTRFWVLFVLDAGFWHWLDSTLALKRGPKRPVRPASLSHATPGTHHP